MDSRCGRDFAIAGTESQRVEVFGWRWNERKVYISVRTLSLLAAFFAASFSHRHYFVLRMQKPPKQVAEPGENSRPGKLRSYLTYDAF